MADLLICIQHTDFPSEIPNSSFLPESSPVVLCGPVELLRREKIAVLNSRQSPRLSKKSTWIKKTLEALQSFDPTDTAILSSLNTTSWDFLTWAAGKMGFPLVLVFPAGSAQNFNIYRTKAILDLGLDERKTLAVKPLIVGQRRRASEANALRDRWIMALSHSLFPISIRTKGNFERYLDHPELSAETVQHRFEIQYEAARSTKKPVLSGDISLPAWYRPRDYLIHWTRSCVGPWPDETKADYFRRIMESGEEALSGFDTLLRILKEGVIRASGRLVRGGYPVVPFTARPPQDLQKLLMWRPGLRRWTFEPYGIAIKKSLLIDGGARPAKYGDLNDFDAMGEEDRPFFQMLGTGKRDWRAEKEWRISGDVSFKSLKGEDVTIFVNEKKEASLIDKKFTYPIISLQNK